ncbi:MAG: glycerophosphoryl diester phosphodiesterase [Solirubrobacterales bacterium]|jgi:glycerophosphoryl diester phosphodiesterase|nr:glycerophosphoryl diester phosphodiesterase [Solirubrobacterales bacterium]
MSANRQLRLVAGPKGTYGNTLQSFHSAVATAADTIEIDVIWLPDSHLPVEDRAPLVVAHDWEDARRRTPLPLSEALDAFLQAPLDEVEINLDIKLPGREEELVEALRERDLVGRAMISTLELYSLGRIKELEPNLRRGWSYPKASKDWSAVRWARVPLLAAVRAMRYRLPGLAAQQLPKLGVDAMWVYHPLVSPRLSRICALAGVELIAWKVDDEASMRTLVNLGASGLCSSKPELYSSLRPDAS